MSLRFPSMFFGAALFGALLLPSAQADEWNKKTVITVAEPVQMPSCCTPDHTVTLQPGTYVLVLVDSLSDRHIVRVYEKDEKTVVTTVLAIPNLRLKPTGNSSFQFWETPAGQPRAMRAWFYPGDNFGQEFAYYKTQSSEIAKVAKAPVPTANVEQEAELKTAALFTLDEKGTETPLKVEAPAIAETHEADRVSTPEPVATVEVKTDPTPAKVETHEADRVATPEPVATAEVKTDPTPAKVETQEADRVVTPEPAATAQVKTDPAPVSLPKTSSPFPLVGLFGLGSLAFSGLLSRFSKRG